MDTIWINRYMAKAKLTLGEAQQCLAQDGLHRAAITRAYYALYQAANAWMEFKRYPRKEEPDSRRNWHHNEVNKHWERILVELNQDEFGADKIYNAAQGLRVRVEYQTNPEPHRDDAEGCVDDCKRAVGWLLDGLKREGFHGNR